MELPPFPKALWAGAAVVLCLSLACLEIRGIQVRAGPAYALGVVAVILAPVALRLRERWAAPSLQRAIGAAHGVALFTIISCAGCLASYAIACFGQGFADSTVAAMDRQLGVDWLSLYRFALNHPYIEALGQGAYLMIGPFPVLIIAALALTGEERRITRFLSAYALSLALTDMIFLFFPMKAALLYWVGDHPPYMPATGTHYAIVVAQLQAGTFPQLRMEELSGLIGFPSFHAAAALLYIWAAWPLKTYRYPVLALNLAMLAATPVEGAHFVSDVVAGLLVATLGIAAVVLLTRRVAPADRAVPHATVASRAWSATALAQRFPDAWGPWARTLPGTVERLRR